MLQYKYPLYTIKIAVVSLVSVLLFSCGGSGDAPDVSNIHVDLNTRRLDKDLAALDTSHLGAGLQQLSAKYPDFLNFYLDTLMGFGVNGIYEDTAFGVRNGLHALLTHPDYRGLLDTVAVHFPDTKQEDAALTKAFRYYKYYFPSRSVPKIIYLISGFNHVAFTYDTTIVGIGLDMFLGAQYPFYASVGVPAYMSRKLTPDYIVPNVMQVLYEAEHPFVTDGRNLLDMMIQKGKEQYYLEQVAPFVPDTVRLGFTASQLGWCRASEAEVYNFFVKDKLLYETNWQKILRYVNDGPTATGMPAESPGNVGSWLGLQIVKAYMEQHPETTLDELLQPMDAQRFLLLSRYKPR